MGKSSARELPKTIGRYEVVRQLGVGAMGRVFLARDPVLERHVAIKVLREDLHLADGDRESLLVRMRHEARAAARVTHPNLCIIHDMGEDEDLGLYLVFEYIEGPTLKQRLEEGRLTPRQAARVAREIGSALTFAHERGVLHRDVKPENLILSPTGTKLTDFGIARVPDSTLTHAGGLLGTPAYSAPETFQKGTFSPESDQFSFAATLYEAIRGARAFPGDDAISVASKIANDPPEPFAVSLRYAAEVDELLQRAMAKDPDARFPSCEELGNKLTELLMLRTTLTGPEGSRVFEASTLPSRTSHAPRVKSIPPPQRSGLRWFALGVVALIGLGLLVRSALRYKPTTPADPPAPIASEPTALSPPPSQSVPARPRKPPPVKPPISPASSRPVDEPKPASSADVPPNP